MHNGRGVRGWRVWRGSEKDEMKKRESLIGRKEGWLSLGAARASASWLRAIIIFSPHSTFYSFLFHSIGPVRLPRYFCPVSCSRCGGRGGGLNTICVLLTKETFQMIGASFDGNRLPIRLESLH